MAEKRHFCPSCERRYSCPLSTAACGSPEVYDCHACYLARHREELEVLLDAVEERFSDACARWGGICYAH